MKTLLVATLLLGLSGSAWLGAKIRQASAPVPGSALSNSNGGNWSYRRAITVSNPAGNGALSDYQLPVSTDVYLEGLADPSLKGFWRLDESSGTSAADSSGNGKTGTLAAAASWTTGKFGNALSFSGTQAVNLAGLDVDTTTPNAKTTVEMWVYWNGTLDVMPFGFWMYDIVFASNGSSVGFNTGNGDCYGTPHAGLANKWIHLAAVFNNGSVSGSSLYINGVKKTLTQYGTPNSVNATANAGIGSWTISTTNRFRGSIDEVRIYNRALTDQEIANHAASAFDFGASLVGSWHFGEGSGTTASDLSGGGSTGTMNGADYWTANGRYGSAFNAVRTSSNHLSAADSNNWYFSADYTVAFWFKTDRPITANTYMPVFDQYQNVNNYYLWSFYDRAGQRVMLLTGRNNVASNTWNAEWDVTALVPGDDLWHHFALRRSANSYDVYVDGAAVGATYSNSATPLNFAGPLKIGGSGAFPSEFAQGVIDEYRVYQRALTVGEIAELAKNPNAPSTSDRPKVRLDLGDLRFSTNADGSGELPYWLESDKKAWVTVPALATGTSIPIYLFYGNMSATSSSSSANTFVREIANATTSWGLDEGSGTTAADALGFQNCTLVSGAAWTTGKYGNGVNLTGSSTSYLNCGTGLTSAFSAPNSFTVEGWIYPTAYSSAGNWKWILSKAFTSHTSPYYQFDIRLNSNGAFTAAVWGTSLTVTTAASAVPLNQWTYFAVTVDKSTHTLSLYLNNGAPLTSTSAPPTYNSYNTAVTFGANVNIPTSTTYNYVGKMDELRVYGRALTAAEIADLHAYRGFVASSLPGRILLRKSAAAELTSIVGGESTL